MRGTFWMKQSRQENIIYLAVWGLLFAAPLLSLYVRTISDTSATFDWAEVLLVWRKFAVYLLLFLVHNFLLAPLLVHQHKRLAYFSFVALLLGAFVVYQCSNKPIKPSGPPPHEMARHDFQHPNRPDLPDLPDKPDIREEPDFPEHLERPDHQEHPQRPIPPHDFRPDDLPPTVGGERDLLAVVVLVLMLSANLGIKEYVRSRDDSRRLAELEKQNLEQQLEYLRYQINPHFFMNTLNNIHALVDIDPAKAQETIVELSKMMRFVLYEGDKRGVPLTKEMDFIRTYVKLMQLRYTDKVRIALDLPTEVPDRSIPPLVLISFIENAFKHGISYQHESFIDMKAAVEGSTLHFICRNSKADHAGNQPQQGGVGLANVKKRLDLLYDHDYLLHIQDEEGIYTVDLVIPL